MSANSLIGIDNSENITIHDIQITDVPNTLFTISKSIIKEVTDLNISETGKVINLKDSTIKSISNSTFTKNGNKTVLKGGAIQMSNSELSINN